MTSEVETLKTNEFHRRRKLRLQQVREQSKDIAKKIRERAKTEKLRQVVDLDANKQKEYFQKQEQLVKRLEQLYAKGIENIGASHRSAGEVKESDNTQQNIALSKKRGKVAVAVLRKQKQDILDQHKKVLDQKLRAREAANELSREKSAAIVNKLAIKNSTSKPAEDNIEQSTAKKSDKCAEINNKPEPVSTNDMATQWDFDGLLNEWEPSEPVVTQISLPKDDRESIKELNNNTENKLDKNKRPNLFALSAEMPSSLCGSLGNVDEARVPQKSSLTLISEYLQNRGMHLREYAPAASSNKQSDDLQSLRQTILRTRATKPEAKFNNVENSTKSSTLGSGIPRKPSVTIYNHSTRDTRDLPYGDDRLVVRDARTDQDAYSQAMKETSDNTRDKETPKKIQEMRNKVAMTKQSIEKEYKDTMTFLNSMPKEKCSKSIRDSYMDVRRQRLLKECRQQKMQQEYRKIEKECKKHTCKKNKRGNSNSPSRGKDEDGSDSRDFQYSWMPVPESDSSLAVHTIPTTLKEGKQSNTVKFSKVDSYHEYRSRHRHTPPTKDTSGREKTIKKKVEKVLIQNGSETTDSSAVTSDTSSVENLRFDTSDANDKSNSKDGERLSDAERIIIYKILDSKKNREKKKTKLVKDVLKSLNKSYNNVVESEQDRQKKQQMQINNAECNMSIEHLREGVYKTVNEKGDNVTSMYYSDSKSAEKNTLTEDGIRHGRPCLCKQTISDDHQPDKGTIPQWESGEDPKARYEGNEKICRPEIISKESQNTSPMKLASAATSTSSFKTASNDKANNAPTDSSCIKFVDEGGQEAGKFYIGASGFLKDDAYEVVIQLRKKENDGNINEKENINDKLTSVEEVSKITGAEIKQSNTSTETNNAQQIIENEGHEYLTRIPGNNTENLLHPCSEQPNTNINDVQELIAEHNKDSLEGVITKESTDKTSNLVDKGVSTSFQLSYAIADNVLKSEPTPRPATSTYTQTTLNSPNHRPMYFHMSSSTSTAYMSPPEVVLPKFMRHDIMDAKDMYSSNQSYNLQEEIDISEQNEYSDKFTKCKCKRCVHAKTMILNNDASAFCNQIYKHRHINLRTPPNTTRSSHELHKRNQCDIPSTTNKLKFKCHKHESHVLSNICIKSHKNKKYTNSNRRPCRNYVMHVNANEAPLNKNKIRPQSRSDKSNLNPVVKEYVHKLLALNKESLKAIKVTEQDCSSVTTPGSSIINVPNNINENKITVDNKISLEQIKCMFKQRILSNLQDVNKSHFSYEASSNSISNAQRNTKMNAPRMLRKKSVHKVKSLNISKCLLKPKISGKAITETRQSNKHASSLPTKEEKSKTLLSHVNRTKSRSKSSPTPRIMHDFKVDQISSISNKDKNTESSRYRSNEDESPVQHQSQSRKLPSHRATSYSTSPDSGSTSASRNDQRHENILSNISTQTNKNSKSETNFMKIAEDKLQNMEKIADLTDKCTKRLSNLAKVLEEVRKNKSLVYSQISTSDSATDSDQKSDKIATNDKTPTVCASDNPISTDAKSDSFKRPTAQQLDATTTSQYIPFLVNIPKPAVSKTSDKNIQFSDSVSETLASHFELNSNGDVLIAKNRGKPPPAMSRLHLKHGQEYLIPHELSTVLEVDSPVSIKNKNQSNVCNDPKCDLSEVSNLINNMTKDIKDGKNNKEPQVNPDLLQNNDKTVKVKSKKSSSGSSDESKLQMMDMKKFNDIMLKPFISIQEYAKQNNVGALDDISNIDDIPKDDVINDDFSSLHSDGSLPDVISELLKRNLITEPFKFDSESNVNSNTVSSESSLSILALSKIRMETNKTNAVINNIENAVETSDTLSISSNPDLENAFKKLGIGWASSTLKKTKERLALSSSSNTSSSSLTQYKIKNVNNQDIPALVTDSVSSLNLLKKSFMGRNVIDRSKNAEQQTSLANSMTVKEFLANELSKKITFTNNGEDSVEEFISLAETKMPEEMKHSQSIRNEQSFDSLPSAGNNRARTSTPVQIFKSMTYHSSSSSNMSNGLFSNADDLSSVKVTSNSLKNYSTSEKDELTIPNYSLKMKKSLSDASKSD